MLNKVLIMNKIVNIFILLSVFVLSSCSYEKEDVGSASEGVYIEFSLPGMYEYMIPDARTKANDIITPYDSLRHLDVDVVNLPVGSTLWLTFSEKNEDGTYTEPELKAYKIIDNGGYHSMYACTYHQEIGADGYEYQVIDDEANGQPLILSDGTYRFKMISPALPICFDEEKGWRLPVDNGMYFYATDGRYHETIPKDIVVDSKQLANDGHNVQYVRLNPIVNQTARWNFNIFKGENVDSLMMLPAGIEISGLQNPYDTVDGKKEMFYWASNDIRDTLKMKCGDKRQWVKIPAEEMWVEDVRRSNGQVQQALRGAVGFLPTNSLSTTVVILFNMLVNGIPTQYETTLNGSVYEHAHSYNVSVEVSQKDGIIVFNWQNQSWVEDLELN